MVKIKSVQRMEPTDIAEAAVTAIKIAAGAVETAKINDAAVETAKVADSAVETAKINDAAVETAKVADSAVEYGKINDNFAQIGATAIDSVSTLVDFPTAFPASPEVMAIGVDVTGVKVQSVDTDSFEWIADAAGSARWFGVYKG